MESKSNYKLKLLLKMGFPLAVVVSVSTWLVWYVTGLGMGAEAVFIIWGISLVSILLLLFFSAYHTEKKLNKIEEIVRLTALSDFGVAVNKSEYRSKDKYAKIAIYCQTISENTKRYRDQVKLLAEGDLTVEVSPNSENDFYGQNLLKIKQTLKYVSEELNTISDQADLGLITKTEIDDQLTGAYRMILVAVNRAMDKFADKIDWYEAILDALPFPIQVMDNDLKWIYLNKVYEGFLVSSGAVDNRASALGMDCCNANSQICNTVDCGVKRLIEKNEPNTYFEFGGLYNKMDTAQIKNRRGENIGFVEVASDLTPMMKVTTYLKEEVTRLQKNLKSMADGDLDFDLGIKAPDAYTKEVSEQFEEINISLKVVQHSVGAMIDAGMTMTEAVLNGDLDKRTDASIFKGTWKNLVGGMNSILGAVAKPFDEVSQVMHALEQGNLQLQINGSYEGKFNDLKKSVNTTTGQLKLLIGIITELTTNISNGNLNIERISDFDGDMINISNALNASIESLNIVFKDINVTADQVAVGASQVSDGSQSLAQGSTEQASSLQELTASIAEISDQTKQNAISANRVKELATDVMNNATKGNNQMKEMQKSMTEINESSQNISKIIKVIDDIAFQTNILALNAAVEAARAGQHGKGFAVVAEEVRTLAARSADAAKETTALIEGSISKVQLGTRIADDTASALKEIVNGIKDTSDLVIDIAKASNEQALNIAQINMGINQVAQVIQLNSATSEQSAAASEELSGQSEMLKEMINRFQLREG